MELWVADGTERIGLCQQAEFDLLRQDSSVLAWQHRLDLNDPWRAEAFVHRHLRGPGELYELRSLLARQTLMIHRLSDEQVLRQVANELCFGNLRADLYAWRPHPTIRDNDAGDSPVVVPAPVSVVSTTPPSAPVEPVPVVSSEAPVAAVETASAQPTAEVVAAQDTLAAMLEQAAQDAAPFCEVCELARRSRAAAPAESPAPAVAAVQDAQAAALEQAAKEAVPFCEVCELARVSPPVAPAPSPSPAVAAVQDAQAAALEQAAVSGTPFCEACERMR